MATPRELPNRLDTLRAFIRNQANLTDSSKPTPGPGSVKLNHEEAALVADWLDELAALRAGKWRVYTGDPNRG